MCVQFVFLCVCLRSLSGPLDNEGLLQMREQLRGSKQITAPSGGGGRGERGAEGWNAGGGGGGGGAGVRKNSPPVCCLLYICHNI